MISHRIVGIALAVCVTLCASLADAAPPQAPDVARYNVSLGVLPAKGPADAPITIVEWSDFACRYCQLVRDQLAALEHAYPMQLRWVYRQFPLDDDNSLLQEAVIAAAAQGAFWAMSDRLFSWQGRVTRGDLLALARELGLDALAFDAALATHAHREAVLTDMEGALALGVAGTPAFFINGRPVFGNQPLSAFVTIIEEELAASRRLAASGVATADQYQWLMARASAGPIVADAASPGPTAAPARGIVAPPQLIAGTAPPSRRWGAANPSVHIVMWSDLECSFCARQLPTLLRVAGEYPGDVAVSYRHFPLAMHAAASLAAQASEAAAAQGKFWPFAIHLLASKDRPEPRQLMAAARAVGLDLIAFERALGRGTHKALVDDELAIARTLGLSGTPALIINGTLYDGALDDVPLRKAIELARTRTALATGMSRADAVMLASIDGRASPLDDPTSFIGAVRSPVGTGRLRALVAACHRGDVSAMVQRLASLATGSLAPTSRELARWQTWCERTANVSLRTGDTKRVERAP
ncbi:MAG: thioredoxin domain-containing protein [Myxococcales bacterium]|nr:thioredoxin domain-containing protein [Myxococcales bacterium]